MILKESSLYNADSLWSGLKDESFRFNNRVISFPDVSLRSAPGYLQMNPYGFAFPAVSLRASDNATHG
ncbi:MAG: hypothetical protein NC421_10105 [Lachnospiraceae bacterium]|nr:hypothetical protein [Lachnospiraceae bacterium]